MPKKTPSDIAFDKAVADSVALQKSPEYKAKQAEELAAMVKQWRGRMPVSRAAQLLGMSKRTLEGIEQGRGFTYPLLLTLAIQAFK